MNELQIKGKKYISSKRASELTGYAKDYVGQLVRMGKLPAERVGRSWFIEEASILAHAGVLSAQGTDGNREESKSQVLQTIAHKDFVENVKTWSPVNYSEDSGDLIPAIQNTHTPYGHSGNSGFSVAIKKVTPSLHAEGPKGGIDGIFREGSVSVPEHKKVTLDQKPEQIAAPRLQVRYQAPRARKGKRIGALASLVVASLMLLFVYQMLFMPFTLIVGAETNTSSAFSSSVYFKEFSAKVFSIF